MEFNLLIEMERDGFDTSRKSNSRSGQYNGPCILPSCNGLGKDRLRVQPNQGEHGWFACNVCGAKGTGIDYLIQKRGYSKQQALAEVGWKPRDGSTPLFIIPRNILEGDRYPTHEAPPEKWQESAKTFVQYCEDILWSEQGQQALDYLHTRGLNDETIRAAKLGYNPTELRQSGPKWGHDQHGKLAKGIVIPWFIGADLWRITIRDELIVDGENRYKQVAGGSNGLYLADSLAYHRPVVLVEGEIDALSVVQEANRDVSVCATGTTEGSHTARWIAALARKDLVLIAFDAEAKGDKAANWWLDRLENAQRLRPWWKDANQMLQDDIDLLDDWILPGIDSILAEAAEQNDQVTSEADINEPCLCDTCLDLDIDKETPAPYEVNGDMYCAEHHPPRQALITSADALIAQCPGLGLQVHEIFHISQEAEVKRRMFEEYSQHEIAEQRRRDAELKATIRQANEAKRRAAQAVLI
jgi:DNA primase